MNHRGPIRDGVSAEMISVCREWKIAAKTGVFAAIGVMTGQRCGMKRTRPSVAGWYVRKLSDQDCDGGQSDADACDDTHKMMNVAAQAQQVDVAEAGSAQEPPLCCPLWFERRKTRFAGVRVVKIPDDLVHILLDTGSDVS